ncbi:MULTISPECIES: methyltransferase type 11 [Brevundimonas]|uniref:methyltransferase type 11 n=1 Tax=Brevundimonas sp. ZS04 TaxID=1906854 RepID=UPI0018E9A6FA|nr:MULTISPECIES: methyltransferase type 11 [Brevundimonas]
MTPEDIALLDRLYPEILRRVKSEKLWKENLFIPAIDVYRVDPSSEFMTHSTCSSRDFFHPEFKRISDEIGVPSVFHRKYWEWVYIVHHAYKSGAVASGKKGLVFGVGQETLPAVFAASGMKITATDAPRASEVSAAWQSGNEYAEELAAMPSGQLSREEFERLVEWRECDMNAIDDSLKDYDLCWSSCCLEHLGSLQHGIDFIINSVEKTLRVGGVAIHTTEFNLSSNEDTVDTGWTVLYRRRDFEELIRTLEERGHEVSPFVIAPDSLSIDGFVDTPPYSAPPHLKLALEGYVSTSAGLVIRRGR